MKSEEALNSHQAIELALVRARARRFAAGDKTATFGDLMNDARQELKEMTERFKRTGKDDYELGLIGRERNAQPENPGTAGSPETGGNSRR